jgi:membrane-associated phospholipid phosphatase
MNRRFAGIPSMKHYTFVDYATQAYLLVVALLMLFFHSERTPNWRWLLPTHLVVMALIHFMIQFHARRRPRGFAEFLRYFYPVLLFTGFYRETGELHHMFFPEFLDPVLIRIEEQIFGYQPSLLFMDRLPYLLVSELFYAAYFSYYIMILGVGIALYLRNRYQFFHYVSVVAFVFYICYLTYIILPVMGPRAFYRDEAEYALPPDVIPAEVPAYPESVQRGPFYQIMAVIYEHLEAPGAAFPSSHVAVALATVWFSFLYLRRIRHVHLVVAILLCISTVYCRYHYIIDVIAGILTTLLLVPLGHWLYFRFSDPNRLKLSDSLAPSPAIANLAVSLSSNPDPVSPPPGGRATDGENIRVG